VGTTITIVGARGHGHDRLEHLTIGVDGTIVLDLPAWDPRFQSSYTLVDPLVVPLDAMLSLECTYAAPSGSYDEEMCGGWVFFTD
jgi:hypothetical protein